MRHGLCLFLVVCVCACSGPDHDPRTDALADGVYEVLAADDDPSALPSGGAGTRVLVFDRQFIDGGSALPPEHVLLRIEGHAPLDLTAPPTTSEANGRPVLLLTLDAEAGRSLEALTSRAERAAVVVGGTIVTVHRIRTPIEGGRLQVSC